MGHQTVHPSGSSVWKLTARQHGVVARAQLLELGFSPDAIKHRVSTGRLHPIYRGVYSVGRPALTESGRWMAAVLSCGAGAVLSHQSAAALWGVGKELRGQIEVSVPAHLRRRRPGVVIHRRTRLDRRYLRCHRGIPVTSPALTLVDLGTRLPTALLEAAINEADKRDLISADALRAALEAMPRRPGAGALRQILDSRTFALTDSELERLFLRIARSAGLPLPKTGERLNGFKVDFYWPELGLVVETDGLRYHRTPAEQARDRMRDQAHTAAGLTPLRFTHAQIKFEPADVGRTLAAVVSRLPR